MHGTGTPLTEDLDYRDARPDNPPIIDLDANNSTIAPDTGENVGTSNPKSSCCKYY